jgi:hypothetical protein
MNSRKPHVSARHGASALATGVIGLMVCLLAGSEPAIALDQQASVPLGRLFMSPEERRALDAGRVPWRDSETSEAGLAPTVSRVMLNGVLKRSAGPAVVFINGQLAGGKDAAIQVSRGPDRQNAVTLQDSADGRSVRLKPGQSWTP